MKKIDKYPLLLILCCCLFTPKNTSAQIGWKWLTGAHPTAIDSASFDAICFNLDNSSNQYTTGSVGGVGAFVIGSDSMWLPNQNLNIQVIKTDAGGNFLWSVFGVEMSDTEATFPVGSVVDSIGNFYLLGEYGDSFQMGGYTVYDTAGGYFLAKITPSGSVAWLVPVCTGPGAIVDGIGSPIGNIAIDKNGYVYVSGSFILPTATFGTTTLINANASGVTSDIFVAKFDPAGNPLWAKRFGGNGSDGTNCMTVGNNGNIYISFLSSSDSFSLAGTNFLPAYNVVTGSNVINLFAALDSNGNAIWAHAPGVYLGVYGMIHDQWDNIYLTGNVDGNTTIGSTTLIPVSYVPGVLYPSNYFVAKYDYNGNAQWAKMAANSPGESLGSNSISVDLCGNLWATASGDSVLFDSNLIYTHLVNYVDPAFVVEFNDSGTFLQGLIIPSGGDDWVNLAVDNQGDFFLSSDYTTTLTLGSTTLPYDSSEQFFVAKYTYEISGCGATEHTTAAPQHTPEVKLYPNPTYGTFTIQTTYSQQYTITISNIVGDQVYRSVANAPQIEVDISTQPPGVYFVHLLSGQQSNVQKIVVSK